MRNIIIIVSLIFLVNCKENVQQNIVENHEIKNTISISKIEFYQSRINRALLTKLDRKKFRDEVLFNINKLYKEDNSYKMLKLVTEKVSKEINVEAFELGLINFKNEYVKKTILN